MKDKFAEWFGRNRKTIGYTVGGLNLFAGLSYFMQGQIIAGIIWLVIGAMIVFDTKEYK